MLTAAAESCTGVYLPQLAKQIKTLRMNGERPSSYDDMKGSLHYSFSRRTLNNFIYDDAVVLVRGGPDAVERESERVRERMRL